MHLHTVCTVHPDHVLVSLHGDADVLTAPLLRQAFGTALRRAEHRYVVADLCGVDFMDHSGARPLVEADQILHVQSRRLWLACLHSRTARILRGIRLDDYFPVLPVTVAVPRCQHFDPGWRRWTAGGDGAGGSDGMDRPLPRPSGNRDAW
ncbi:MULTISPECIES: STAS domain-containing protein [unclassified Streptomyces]|uniref:STAS domain-containing protein n=1 Tax=unclassified Streptomyces TaxID=2593676 RepID=UPI001F049E17|nr:MULTISPECIES: STAS domain-containing protein [unclassified Streptomyces]MCH0567028.1 STAS domain-containing protein [Streptomyces sp. MUM 2J]MCH0572395.1 STAS domain-containing protein [Streptomyces sp. MUM 136J]